MQKPLNIFYTKTIWLLLCIVTGLVIIGARLFHLQIQKSAFFLERSKRNFTRYEIILPQRGNIIDTHGSIIATNRPVTALMWQGSGNKIISQKQHEHIHKIEELLEISLENNYKKIELAEKHFQKLVLLDDISFEQLSKIVEVFSHSTNIVTETRFKRFYPYKTIACHLLGYLGVIDNTYGGKTGIEKICEQSLRGTPGSLLRIINSIGSHLFEEEIEKTKIGQDIRTTLDLPLQQLAEQVFPPDITGIFILMDPHTGALKAVISRPNFDPNMFLDTIDKHKWNMLNAQTSFLNRLCKATYPPGSIFKLVTVSAGLETGIITKNSIWRCCGYTTLAGRKYHCSNKLGHGELTTQQAVARSCNPMFFEIGKKLDIDTLAKYAHMFGLGQTTNTLLSEDTGLIPTREWKKRVKHERWWLGDNLSVAIGQSYLLVTPLQIARMIAAIETGFLVSIRFLEETPIIKQKLALRADTRAFLNQAMLAVTTSGTARRLSYFDDFVIKSKTSTAQMSCLTKRALGEQFLEHGWYACNFSYRNQNPFTMIILTEHSGGTSVPQIIGKEFLRGYRKLMQTSNQATYVSNHSPEQDESHVLPSSLPSNLQQDIPNNPQATLLPDELLEPLPESIDQTLEPDNTPEINENIPAQ